MSKLDELLRELCPDGVEYKRFDEVCTLNARIGWQRLTKAEYMSKGDYLLITGTDFTETHEIDYSTCVYVTEERYKQDSKIQLKSGVFVVRCKDGSLENRFILHYLLSNHFQSVVEQQKTGSTISHLTQTLFSRLMIPIPPLEIQREIVRILDNFTNLTAELTKELTDRKVQYAYYRNKFLYFDESSASLKSIGDICNVVVGGEPPADCIKGESKDSSHMFPVWGNGKEAYGYSGTYKIDRDAVVISSIGANTGAVYYRKAFFTPIIRLKVVMPKDNQLSSRFLFHVLSATAIKSKSSSVPNMNANEIKAIKIPVPPLDVQNRIVNVLDNFEKICSDLNIGLPAEIEARQKQYEYYRDKLLTFAETGNTILNGTERNGTERNGTLIKLLRYVFGYVRIPLGDVGSICMCKRILKSQTNTASGVPFYKIGTFGKEADAYISQETFDEYRSRYNFPKKGDVLISAAGTIGRTVVYDGKPAYFQDSNIVWIDNDESIVLNSYLRYCYELKPWKASEGGTIPRLYNDNIAKAVIAVPSIEEQKRIVSILDRFDAICNDLTSGLPAEIEARQKQYEYYRDKLLNFRKYKDESSN